MKSKRLSHQIALITGASRGIGRAVALRFAEEGAHVIALARTSGALEELDDEIQHKTGASATLVPFDLEKLGEIESLAKEVHKRFKRLDILVGNAGILGGLSPITDFTPNSWQKVQDINLNANWHLIRNFDPLLKLSDSGRVIFVTSTVGSIPRSYWGAYAVSKAGLEMLTKIYADEQIMTNINANLVNPGATRTAMRAQAMPGEKTSSIKLPENITEYFVQLAEKNCDLNGQIIDCTAKVANKTFSDSTQKK